jgi:hypothetical protein
VPTFAISNSYLNVHGLNVSPAYIEQIQSFSRTRPYVLPMIDNAYQRDIQPAGGSGFAPLVNQFKGLAAYIGWWLRESQQVNDNTGNSLFQWDNSAPWTDVQLLDRSSRIMSSPNPLLYSFVRNTIRPREFKAYANPAQNNVEFAGLYNFCLQPFRLQNTIGEVLALGNYQFQTTQAAFLQITAPVFPVAETLDGYEVFFNAIVLQNGRLSKYLA